MDRNLIEAYITLILNNEDLIYDRIDSFLADEQNSHFSAIDLKIPVSDVNETLLIGSKLYGLVFEGSISACNKDPVWQFGQTLAQRYLLKGIPMGEFYKVLKIYRQIYSDFFQDQSAEQGINTIYSHFTERCFDRIEFGAITEWTKISVQKSNNQISSISIQPDLKPNKYLSIFENLSSPLIVVDEKDRILNFNLAASYIFPHAKIGNEIFTWQFESEDEKTDFISTYKTFKHSEDNLLIVEKYLQTHKGKQYFRILMRKFAGIDNSFQSGLIGFEDLTEIIEMNNDLQKAKSNAEESDRLKTAFLANMSHEIRTPMHAIIGFTELLINGKYDQSERKEYLELIRRSSNDLFNIIEDLIDIAKMESKQLKIKYKDCQPYKILDELYPVFHESMRGKSIIDKVRLILKVDQEYRQFHIFTDGERLKQVISNLVNNAIKFTDEGFIEYGFKLIGKDQLLFYVRDTGSGIPEEMKDKIFDRFFQLKENQEKNHNGAGLGLAICKNIVDLLGGEIWLESVIDEGSCFNFLIPIRDVPEELRLKSLSDANFRNSQPNWDNKRILVAEDDQINFIYIQEILTRCGVQVIHAKNGVEAIDIAEIENRIDLILMDIKMPEINGLEAAKYISKTRPEIPIIALTAFAMDGDESMCMKAGCIDYLSKPIDRDQLYLKIDKYIHAERTRSSHNTIKMK